MLLAGLRPGELMPLLVRDWQPGDDPKLTVHIGRHQRTIRVAPSAAAAVDAYLAGRLTQPDEQLLLIPEPHGVPRLVYRTFSSTMQQAGLHVRSFDLATAAEAVVLDDGTPTHHIAAYFGPSKTAAGESLPLPEDYDRGIAAVLGQTFAG
jgi:hypothetical protein